MRYILASVYGNLPRPLLKLYRQWVTTNDSPLIYSKIHIEGFKGKWHALSRVTGRLVSLGSFPWSKAEIYIKSLSRKCSQSRINSTKTLRLIRSRRPPSTLLSPPSLGRCGPFAGFSSIGARHRGIEASCGRNWQQPGFVSFRLLACLLLSLKVQYLGGGCPEGIRKRIF